MSLFLLGYTSILSQLLECTSLSEFLRETASPMETRASQCYKNARPTFNFSFTLKSITHTIALLTTDRHDVTVAVTFPLSNMPQQLAMQM
jgi:hypothetical protein